MPMIRVRTLSDFVMFLSVYDYAVILLALAGIALFVACALKVRRATLVPPFLVSQLEQVLNLGDVEAARELCARATPLRNVLFAGLARLDSGPEAAARVAHLGAERERLALRRLSGWLLLFAVSAALFAALGPAVRLRSVYDVLSVAPEGSSFWELHSKALFSSEMGLSVAVPLLGAWWFFSARAAMLANELETTAEDLIFRVRNAPVARERAGAEPRERT